MEENHKSKLSKWLELLQQESWQLELIISGFAIFLVASLYDPLIDLGVSIEVAGTGLESTGIPHIFFAILSGAWFFLLVNLICHVVLRGFWIAAIGLRYISGEIDFDELRLSPKFDAWLRKKTIPYDEYIERLEKYCSVVFAFTFLIIFMFIALGMFFMVQILGISLFRDVIEARIDVVGELPKLIFILVYNFFGLLYFLDFVSLGKLKRVKWFSKIYFPIYRFFSLITLSFLYRPLYYNLIDNKFGRRLGYFLVPYVLIVLIGLSFRPQTHFWFPMEKDDHGQTMQHEYYDDLRPERAIVSKASIPSKYLDNDFLELFIPYRSRRHDERLTDFCPDFEPFRKSGYYASSIKISSTDFRESAADTALQCFKQLHEIYINDSLYLDLKYHFYTHPDKKEKGVLTIIDVAHLNRGQHDLKIDLRTLETEFEDSVRTRELVTFPFWKQ